MIRLSDVNNEELLEFYQWLTDCDIERATLDEFGTSYSQFISIIREKHAANAPTDAAEVRFAEGISCVSVSPAKICFQPQMLCFFVGN